MIRDILQNLTFGHRMVLYRLLIALFLAGMIYYAFFFPKEGDRAMRRAAEAMKRAQSWKIESNQDIPQIQGHLHILQEVACPSNARLTRTQTEVVKGQTHEWTIASVNIGEISYEYNGAADKWAPGVTYGGTPKAICEGMARGDAPAMLPPLSKWARTAFASKGDRRDMGASYCREWKITIPRHNMDPERATVCLGEDDDLPRYFTRNEESIRIFDWNVPIDIQPPQIDPKP